MNPPSTNLARHINYRQTTSHAQLETVIRDSESNAIRETYITNERGQVISHECNINYSVSPYNVSEGREVTQAHSQSFARFRTQAIAYLGGQAVIASERARHAFQGQTHNIDASSIVKVPAQGGDKDARSVGNYTKDTTNPGRVLCTVELETADTPELGRIDIMGFTPWSITVIVNRSTKKVHATIIERLGKHDDRLEMSNDHTPLASDVQFLGALWTIHCENNGNNRQQRPNYR